MVFRDVMKAKSVAQCPVFTVPNRRRFRSCGQNEAWTTLTEAAEQLLLETRFI